MTRQKGHDVRSTSTDTAEDRGPHRRDPRRGRARSGARAAIAAAALVAAVAVAVPGPVRGQQDTVPPDTAAQERPDTLRFHLRALEVEATRPTITGGGASGVELQLDSVPVPPSPTLSQVLEEMPLIRVRQNSRGQVQPSIRGMEEREIAVLVDGVPITLGWDNRTDLSVVPLTAARTVEMVRGLSSVLAGPNVLGGVVEVGITRGPVADSLGTPFRLQSAVDHTGSVNLAGEVRSLFRPGGGKLLVRAGGGYRESDGVELADGIRDRQPPGTGDLLLNSDLEYGNGFLAARWQAPGGAWLSLSTMGFRAERGVTPELHLLGSEEPAPRFWRIPEHWRSVTSVSGGTGWGETPWGRGDLEASVGLDVQHLEISSFDSFAYRDSVGGEVGDDRTVTLRLLGDHTLGAGTLRGALTLAETRHERTLQPGGSDAFEERWWSLGVETEQPLDPEATPGGGLYDPRITLGVSVDGSSYPETGDKPARDPIWGWGGRLSGTVRAADGLVDLHGGVSRKVRFPALRELFSGALGKFVPNPDLGPVTLKVGEVGATLHAEGLELQGIVFQQRLEGSIVRAVVEGGQFQRQNRGETRSTGLELVANGELGPVAVRGDLTLQDVSLRGDDGQELAERPEYQPELVAGLHATAPLVLGLRARGSVEYLGSQFGTDPRTGESVELDPSTYLEIGLERRLFDGKGALPPVRLAASVDNLTDEVIFDQLGLPRPGRTLRIQLEMR